jgi:hypothetical protein
MRAQLYVAITPRAGLCVSSDRLLLRKLGRWQTPISTSASAIHHPPHSTQEQTRAKLARITGPIEGGPDMASKEQRSNREKKKPKQDKNKKAAPAPSPFAAPAQKGGKPTGSPPPFQQGFKK